MHVLQKLNDAQGRRGYEWRFDDILLVGIQRWAARLTVTLASDSPAGAIQIRTRERFRFGDWHHVALTYDGSGKAAGARLYVDGEPAAVDVVRDTLAGPIATDAPLTIGRRSLGPPFLGQIDDMRLYGRVLEPGQIANLAIHYPARARSFRRVRQARGGGGRGGSRLLPDACRAAGAPHGACRAEGAEQGERGVREGHSDRDGDGRDEEAARDVRARARRLSQPDREGAAWCSGDAAAAAEGCAAQSPHTRAVARRSEPSADRARRGESLLADVLRLRHRQDAGGFRRAGGAAGPPGAARLAGHRVRAHGLGCPGDAAGDRDVGDLPSIVERDGGPARTRSGEPAAGARRRDSGSRPKRSATPRWRRAGCSTGRSAAPACCRTSRRDCGRRWRSAKATPGRRTSRAAARTCTAAACIRCGSGRFRRRRSRRSTRPIGRSARPVAP